MTRFGNEAMLHLKICKNGKGDSPRNMSDRFYKNYQSIDWGKKKATAKPGKKQVFKYPSPRG